MGEKYSMKGIQYDPHDLSKNSLLGFSIFERHRFPMIMDSNHCILYDFPIPDECVRLILLPNLLEMSMIQITDPVVFIATVLTAPHCLHANLVVINKPKKRVDVFDPIGKSANSEFGEERKLQERILRAFCCNAHFQFYGETMDKGIQCGDFHNSKKREGGGFCRIWVWLAAQLCAEFPKKSLRSIIDEMTVYAVEVGSINICRGFLEETREGAFKMMRKRNARFSKLYLDLREAPVQTGKSKSAYYLSEKLVMEYLRDIYCEEIRRT
jgi:hypothetical protein